MHDNAELLGDRIKMRCACYHRQMGTAFARAGNHIRTEGAVELDHNLSLWGT